MTSLSTFTAGVASTTASWSEVGLIDLFATSTGLSGQRAEREEFRAGICGRRAFLSRPFLCGDLARAGADQPVDRVARLQSGVELYLHG